MSWLRPFGSTGIVVSALGLGTVKLGRSEGVKYPTPVRIPDDDAARMLLETARAVGVTVIDTAPAYGAAEERLGRLLPGSRDEWVIVTKAGETFEGGVSSFDFSAAGVRASVERSLRRLRTDRVECLLLHSDGVMETTLDDGLLAALERMKREGMVRAFGVSSKTKAGAMEAVRRCDCVMATLHEGATDDAGAIAEASRLGRGVFIKKAFDSGRGLGGGGVEGALRFVYGHAGVSSVIVGTADAGHLRENAGAARRALGV